MTILTHNDVTILDVNLPLLLEEVQTAGLPRWLRANVTRQPFDLEIVFPDGTNQAAAVAVVNAHDATQLTEGQALSQQAQMVEAGADDEARTIPDFVGWTPAEAQSWVQTNVTDLATAKTVLVKMAGMIAAINARVFPRIRAERQMGG